MQKSSCFLFKQWRRGIVFLFSENAERQHCLWNLVLQLELIVLRMSPVLMEQRV